MPGHDERDASPYEQHQNADPVHHQLDAQAAQTCHHATNKNIKPLDDLTLSEYVGMLLRSPRRAVRMLFSLLQDQGSSSALVLQVPLSPPEEQEITPQRLRRRFFRHPGQFRVLSNILGLFLAIWGCLIFVSTPVRIESGALLQGIPYVLLGIAFWFVGEVSIYSRSIWRAFRRVGKFDRVLIVASLLTGVSAFLSLLVNLILAENAGQIVQQLGWWFTIAAVISAATLGIRRTWVARTGKRADTNKGMTSDSSHQPADIPWYMRIHPARIFLLIGALFTTVMTWIGSTGNTFSTLGFYVWLLSIGLWVAVFAPGDFNFYRWLYEIHRKVRLTPWGKWIPVGLALAGILLVAAAFRLNQLSTHPPEMTSDHVEMLLDGQRIVNGQRVIFFANNGGREPFQMYMLALFSQITGLGVSFYSLKLLGAIESLITILIMFWLGVELAGARWRRQGVLLGLAMAALLAASYWHVAISRQAERIMLTPLITAIIIIYLNRGLRHNSRADFIKAGLALGFGLYMYQAIRMLPVFIILAGLAKLIFDAGGWRSRVTTVFNFTVLVLISFVVFVPMFHYSVEHPEEFWRRTTGRLLGDEIIEVTLPNGTVTYRQASLQERIQAFNENVPVLLNNIRNVLLMFNWKGDVAWINGYPNHPAMDAFSGALLLVGIAAWGVTAFKRRDIALWLLPGLLFIMLMPSALSIAYPLENPSHTRTSGAIPAVYAMAGLPLALLAERISRQRPARSARLAAIVLFVSLVGLSNASNTSIYFNQFRQSYITSSLPYTDAGRVLLGFAMSDGSFGNAFMIAYPFWWDHRAVGMEAGLNDWPNGIVSLDQVPAFLRDSAARTGPYRLLPQRDLLFFYSRADQTTEEQLRAWFPEGRDLLVPSYQPGDDFKIYRVPALGEDGLLRFLEQTQAVSSPGS